MKTKPSTGQERDDDLVQLLHRLALEGLTAKRAPSDVLTLHPFE